MDRNTTGCPMLKNSASSLSARRAWIEMTQTDLANRAELSLSARRAWIEMLVPERHSDGISWVALRKESVDRNSTYVTRLPRVQVSLSARRAWIEIIFPPVDTSSVNSRSPQGERG